MDHNHQAMEHGDPHAEHVMSHDDAPAGHAMDDSAPAGQASHAEHGGHRADHSGHELMFRNRFWISLALSVPVLLYSPMLQEWFNFSMPVFPGSNWIAPIFAALVFVIGGVPFLRMAVPELRNRQPGMMTLISLAIAVSFFYSLAALIFAPGSGFFWELVTLIDIMLLGHWLEMRSVRQASGALDELAKLMPDTAERIASDGSVESVQTSDLKTGDLVLVRPGASVPADGEIAEGDSDVNEAMITGESRPVSKGPGDRAIAGSMNGSGSLRVRITATGDQTALAGIMRLVDQAQQSKSRTQILADKAAGWLFYIALGAAVITAIAWIAATGLSVDAAERVATVLVIACPHALGLAIPLVVSIATERAARGGVLITDRLALESMRNIDVVVFDKTGTLTKGEPEVTDVIVDGIEQAELLSLVAAVERSSEHPLAQAIVQHADSESAARLETNGFENVPGHGAVATVDGRTVAVGNRRLMESRGVELGSLAAKRDELANGGRTAVLVALDGQAVGLFGIADAPRETSVAAIDALHEAGVEVVMLTGDNQATAARIAEQLGIDKVVAEVLPKDKAAEIAALQVDGHRVAMVGDGVNDAPALAQADLGIAIGAGTDVAIETADVVLMRSDPLDVPTALTIGRATLRKMHQNLGWAVGYNAVALPIAAGVFVPSLGLELRPEIAALSMSGSSFIVALNALALKGARLPTLPEESFDSDVGHSQREED
ncbi:MAG: heavy metal translocating P-type ATPase [Anaerolineae bacterium]|nr:heavy metal translocating P-type ATPase [Anaerolineae bacterium]